MKITADRKGLPLPLARHLRLRAAVLESFAWNHARLLAEIGDLSGRYRRAAAEDGRPAITGQDRSALEVTAGTVLELFDEHRDDLLELAAAYVDADMAGEAEAMLYLREPLPELRVTVTGDVASESGVESIVQQCRRLQREGWAAAFPDARMWRRRSCDLERAGGAWVSVVVMARSPYSLANRDKDCARALGNLVREAERWLSPAGQWPIRLAVGGKFAEPNSAVTPPGSPMRNCESSELPEHSLVRPAAL